MATDQGKTSNMNALAIVSQDLSSPIPQVGLTTFRAPYTPTHLRLLRRHLRAAICSIPCAPRPHTHGQRPKAQSSRTSPLEARALFSAHRRGYARRGRPRMPRGAQCLRRVRRLHPRQDRGRRSGCRGIHEPSLCEQLVRVSRRARARYGILCREDGFIYDDGVVARLAAIASTSPPPPAGHRACLR